MENKDQLEALNDIRRMMNRSVRFLSLSGLSGVSAGIYALIAGILAYRHIGKSFSYHVYSMENVSYFVVLGIVTLILAVITALFFTYKKTKKENVKLWNEASKTALINMSIPLIIGAIFCLALIKHGFIGFLIPTALVFYGLSLISVSKNSLELIKTLGFIEVILGLTNAFFIGYGILFWMIGFGIFHIVYGIYMYYKFDKV